MGNMDDQKLYWRTVVAKRVFNYILELGAEVLANLQFRFYEAVKP